MPGPSTPANGARHSPEYRLADGARRRLVTIAALVGLMTSGGGPEAVHGQQPAPGASRGCCRELHYLYEATILQIDVMRLRVQVDDATAGALAAAVRGAPRSPALEREVARQYQTAREATLDMEFLHRVSGETFLEHTLKALRELVGDGAVTEADADTLSREVSERFAFLGAAKVRPGDRLQYQVRADTVWTTYTRGDTVLHVDRHAGRRFRDYILATYFAPSSDFRRGLLDQVFRP